MKLNISAGAVAAILACVAWVLRFVAIRMSPPRGDIVITPLSLILAVGSGLLGIYAAARKDGRAGGIFAIVLVAILAVIFFATMIA